MPKRIVRKVVSYSCDICGVEYDSNDEALECEDREMEKQKFKIGDKVKNIFEARVCRERQYQFKGKVIEVRGPMPSDYEYEAKWLGSKSDRLHGHVFEYIVEYKCPICKKKKSMLYFTPELGKIS